MITIAGKEWESRTSEGLVEVKVPVGPRGDSGERELVWREVHEARRLLLLLDREMRVALDELVTAGEEFGLTRVEVAGVLRTVLMEPTRAAILDPAA